MIVDNITILLKTNPPRFVRLILSNNFQKQLDKKDKIQLCYNEIEKRAITEEEKDKLAYNLYSSLFEQNPTLMDEKSITQLFDLHIKMNKD